MNRHTLFTLLLLSIGFSIFAQEQDTISSTIKRGYWLGIAPLSLIDYSDGSSVRLSLEIPTAGRVAAGAEGGIYPDITFTYREHTRGYLIRPFIKYYFNNKNGQLRYIAAEYMYKRQRYKLTDSIELNDIHYEKTYGMSRSVNTFSLKYGQVMQLKKWLLLEYYAGVGIRYMTSTTTLPEDERNGILTGYDNETNIDYGDSMIKILARQTGNFGYPNVVMGAKLNIILKNRN